MGRRPLVDPRNFEVASQLSGETYRVEFKWLQTAISLRHSDTVDLQFLVNGQGQVVAVPHAPLEKACREAGVRLTDDLCTRLAARHLYDALRTGENGESRLLTLSAVRVEELVKTQGQARG
jgi:hypothetical protein